MVARKKKARGNGARSGLTHAEFLRGLREMREDFAGQLREMREDFARRFEAMDRRFEVRFEAIDRRFEAVDRRFEAMDARWEALRDWVSLVVGRLQTRAGRRLEDTVAGALRLALGMYDITPDQVLLRQKITDAEGRIGPAGREYEYDILARDGETYVFEVKSTPEVEDVLRFNDKADLAIAALRPRRWKKVLVTLDKDPAVLHKSSELGILVV